MKQQHHPSIRRIRQRTADLRRTISSMDYVCSGTLHSRSRSCGKPTCHCAGDPSAWHGPYNDWSRRGGGRLLHSVVPEERRQLLEHAITNHRKILRLLKQWEHESAAEILGCGEPNG